MRPHLVLDGLWAAASIVGAGQAHVYVCDAVASASVRAALAELDDDPPVPTAVVEVPPAYVAREESAVVRAIGGGPARPTVNRRGRWRSAAAGPRRRCRTSRRSRTLALIAAHGPRGAPRARLTPGLDRDLPADGVVARWARDAAGDAVRSSPLGRDDAGRLPAGRRPADGGFFGGLLPATRADVGGDPLVARGVDICAAGDHDALQRGRVVAARADRRPLPQRRRGRPRSAPPDRRPRRCARGRRAERGRTSARPPLSARPAACCAPRAARRARSPSGRPGG
jgi:hypothetical protein